MRKKLFLISIIATSAFAQTFSPSLFEQGCQYQGKLNSEEFLIHRAPYEASPPKRPLLTPVMSKATWDIDMSPYAGGEDLLFVHRGVEKIETYLLSKSPLAYSKDMYARTWRLSELVTIWLPINYLAMVVQHEVFGHGYRIRDINKGRVKVRGYSFGTPPPYGDGGGATAYSLNSDFTTTQETAVSMAGVESTAILALLTKFKWIEAGRIDPRQSVLYLLSQHDLDLYVGTLKAEGDLSGHDIHGYIVSLNYTYPDNLLNKGRIRTLSLINLADVFTFYAIYSWFHYLSSGKETKIPMIGSCYLPGLRLGLTPFGPEVFFENFFSVKNFPLYAYAKGGHHAKNDYYGLGVYAPGLVQWKKWVFGIRVDLWRQPQLLLQPGTVPITEIDFDQTPSVNDPLYPASERHAIRYGGSGSVIFLYKGNNRCGFEVETGYKAQGFLPGYSLQAAPVARLSFTLVF